VERQLHDILANPMWASLSTTHAGFATTSGALKRFPPDVAPFCAVQENGVEVGPGPALHPGETVYFLSAIPSLPAHWDIVYDTSILQMVYQGDAPGAASGEDAPTLTDADTPSMLALTALVYPEFYRPRTAVLGKYIGLRGGHGLDAMAGQRLACTGYREISAVCTHPDQRGRGLAGRLIRQLTRDILAEGRTPFLHVSAANKGAWTLYENLGFVASCELRFIKVVVKD
jgi:ribosomal protein S18 acetylase RimI-like enzyme